MRGPWWEPGIDPTPARRRRLESALDRFATQLGAESWTLERPRKR